MAALRAGAGYRHPIRQQPARGPDLISRINNSRVASPAAAARGDEYGIVRPACRPLVGPMSGPGSAARYTYTYRPTRTPAAGPAAVPGSPVHTYILGMQELNKNSGPAPLPARVYIHIRYAGIKHKLKSGISTPPQLFWQCTMSGPAHAYRARHTARHGIPTFRTDCPLSSTA